MPTIGGRAGRLTTDRPKTTPDAARAESTKPTMSSGFAPAGGISGRKRPASQMPASPIGTLIEEDPVPGDKGGDEAADRRPDQRPDERRNRKPGHGRDEVALGGRADQHQPRHRRHHRAAHALQEAGQHELHQRAGDSAGDRADDENGDRDAENALGAELVRHPGADRDEDGERNEIGSQRQLERDRRRADVVSDRRQRGRDHRRIHVLHEKGDRENERDGSVHVDVRDSKRTGGSAIILIVRVITAGQACLAFLPTRTPDFTGSDRSLPGARE